MCYPQIMNLGQSTHHLTKDLKSILRAIDEGPTLDRKLCRLPSGYHGITKYGRELVSPSSIILGTAAPASERSAIVRTSRSKRYRLRSFLRRFHT